MIARLRATLSVAYSQLRHGEGHTLLPALGVALAVLLMTTLVGLGYGTVTAGTDAMAYLDQDLWVTGTDDGSITDAHGTVRTLQARDDVASAQVMAFDAAYLHTDTGPPKRVVGVGLAGNASLNLVDGSGLPSGDPHYANGSYDGPRTDVAVVDRETARAANLSVGDRVELGTSRSGAASRSVRIVGISPTFSTFLGEPSVVVPLSELQTMAGTAGADRAALAGVTVADGHDPAAVRSDVASETDHLAVRTSEDQLGVVFARQGPVLVALATLVAVAMTMGTALVVATQGQLVVAQRRELAALKAAGLRAQTLVAIVVGQGLWIALVGALVGLVILVPLVVGLNGVLADLTGFPDLVKTPPWVLATGVGVALAMGVAGAGLAAWRVVRLSPLAHLEG